MATYPRLPDYVGPPAAPATPATRALSGGRIPASQINRMAPTPRARLNGALFEADSGTGFGDAGDSPTGQIGGGFAGLLYGIVHIQGAVTDADRKTVESNYGV